MTVANTARYAGPYTGTGVSVPYPFSFKVFQTSDLKVVQADADGVQSDLALSVDFTVSLNADQNVSPGGTVTLATPLPVGYQVTLTSDLAIAQTASLTNNGGFYPKVIEDALDRLTILMQEQGYISSAQALRVPEIGGVSVLPLKSARASKTLAFDDLGQPMVVVPTSGSSTDLAISLAAKTDSAKGSGQIGHRGRWLHDKLDDHVSVKDYGAIGDGVSDDTGAILAAIASGATDIYVPAGVYLFTSQIVLPAYVTLHGAGYGLFTATGGTRLLKSGSFNGVVVSGAAQLRDLTVDGAPGNGGDGVSVIGGRSLVSGVAAVNQGRDGIKVGGYSYPDGNNTNLWRVTNCIGRGNVRYGMFIAHEGAGGTPDCNAGVVVGFEASYNGSHGLAISEAFDNQVHGLCSQSNTGQGIYLGANAKGNFITLPYTEVNTAGDGLLDTGSARNFLLGFRGGQNNDGWVDNGSDNVVWGRYGSISTVPLHLSPEAFRELQLLEKTTSGVWSLTKEATSRNMVVNLKGTGSPADVHFKNDMGADAGIRFAVDADSAALRGLRTRIGVTLNFGAIAAGSSNEVVVAISGATAAHNFISNPVFAVPVGISWSTFWDGSNVKVRCTNATAGSITVNGAFNVSAIKLV